MQKVEIGSMYHKVLETRVTEILKTKESPIPFTSDLNRAYGGIFPMRCYCPDCNRQARVIMKGEPVYKVFPVNSRMWAVIRKECVEVYGFRVLGKPAEA